MNEQLAAAPGAASVSAARRRALQVGAAATVLAVAAALWAAYKPQAGGADTILGIFDVNAAGPVWRYAERWIDRVRMAGHRSPPTNRVSSVLIACSPIG